MMSSLPKPKIAVRLTIAGIWSAVTLVVLVLTFLTLLDTEKLQLIQNLTDNQPAKLSRVFYYSLFAQKPPEGKILQENVTFKEGREAQLRAYLEWQKSPMAEAAGAFIAIADKYGLDWRLMPSIAGKESTFGKQIPTNSFNAFGWGVFGDQVLRYNSWADAIEAVGAGLKKYADNGRDTVEKIEPAYCPPSYNSHHAWRDGVKYFQWEIESFPNFK